MKVKVGDKIFDTNVEPVMLIFEDDVERVKTRDHLNNMKDGYLKYCIFPDGTPEVTILDFMVTPERNNNDKQS